MEKIIELKSMELADILGIGDGHIKLIESSVPVSITARGELLTIKGKKSDINHAAAILDEMRGTFTSKGTLLSDDVDNLIKLYKSGEIDLKSNLDITHVIYYGRKGAIGPRTKGQSIYLESVINNDIVFGIGPAGTGKTFLSMAFALSSLEKKEVERIILCRPAVEAGENLGFLPGDLKEKVDPFLRPIYDALYEMMSYDQVEKKIKNGIIEIAPIAFMRGRTLEDCFIILDEAQNTTRVQMKMFLTRIGRNSRMVVVGDKTQIDLVANNDSGLLDSEKKLKNINDISFIYLKDKDVVRHELVRKIINAYENFK